MLTQAIKPAAPNPTTLALMLGNAENWGCTSTIILRDHYQDNIKNQVQMFTLLTGPDWQQNVDIASAWARRHFGPRLLQDTLDDARASLCHGLHNNGPSTDPPPGLNLFLIFVNISRCQGHSSLFSTGVLTSFPLRVAITIICIIKSVLTYNSTTDV